VGSDAPRTANEPRHWRPQRARDGLDPSKIDNPIAEPHWRGIRVLAFFRDSAGDEWGTVEAIDARGEDALPEAMRAFDQLRRSVSAGEAIIDGIVTTESERRGVDVEFASHPDPSTEPMQRDPAFVALDLLRLDDEDLLDVPLLERKRLLDGLISQSPVVRVTPWTGRPLRPWFMTWRRAGFRGIVIKGANSRYVPGSVSNEWTTSNREPRI
jgi:bifunctional non-homologous end joining protein LigD